MGIGLVMGMISSGCDPQIAAAMGALIRIQSRKRAIIGLAI
jgi:hypothetical protein